MTYSIELKKAQDLLSKADNSFQPALLSQALSAFCQRMAHINVNEQVSMLIEHVETSKQDVELGIYYGLLCDLIYKEKNNQSINPDLLSNPRGEDVLARGRLSISDYLSSNLRIDDSEIPLHGSKSDLSQLIAALKGAGQARSYFAVGFYFSWLYLATYHLHPQKEVAII